MTETDLIKAADNMAGMWGFQRRSWWRRWTTMTDDEIRKFVKPETAHPSGS